MAVGFAPEEIDTGAPTRSARLKWVVVVNESLSAGRAANAAVCVAAATSTAVAGLLGQEARDAEGQAHAGLPWAGCAVLIADADRLRAIRASAAAQEDVFLADMPIAAQETRVYDEYLRMMSSMRGADIDYAGVSVVGPRKRVERIVGHLPLMG